MTEQSATGHCATRQRSATEAMLLIKTMDNGAMLKLSEWTGKWYVEAQVEVSDGVVLSGVTEHEDSPEQAVHAYLARLAEVDVNDFGRVLVTRAYAGDERRHWRWNGAAFANEPLDAFKTRLT